MANLYEIDQAIMSCVDMETGELIDPERLEALQMERDQKIEGVALWVKNLQSDALAFKAEKDAFAKREADASKKAEQLKEWLAEALGGQKFSTGKCAVSFRKSSRVEVLDIESVPKELLNVSTTATPNKDAIRALLNAGKEVSGCCLMKTLNTQIK